MADALLSQRGSIQLSLLMLSCLIILVLIDNSILNINHIISQTLTANACHNPP